MESKGMRTRRGGEGEEGGEGAGAEGINALCIKKKVFVNIVTGY